MQSSKKILLATIATIIPAALCFADGTNPDDKQVNYNVALMSLVGMMLILLAVIGLMANTLRQLGQVMSEKIRKEKSDAAKIIKTILLILAFTLPVSHSMAEDAVPAPAPTVQYIQGLSNSDYYLIAGVIIFELFVIFMLAIYIQRLLQAIRQKPEVEVIVAKTAPRKSWFWDKFNAAATLEQEKDILLDHNYDGIRELDNSLPPWWKYGFYLTIIVAIIYIYRYDISHDGPSQEEEYAQEMQKGEEEKAAYLAKSANNVDENSVTQLKDAASIAEGKDLFTKTCAACHVADGGGNVGPNLTDDYWLHGGSIKDIFKSIKYGWQDKGMKSWKDDYSPKQIQLLASFVKSLHGTHPAAPKAPQGDLYIEATPGGSPSADSTKANTKTDSTNTVKN